MLDQTMNRRRKRMRMVGASMFLGIFAVGSSGAAASSGVSCGGAPLPISTSSIINGIVSGAAAGKRRLSACVPASLRNRGAIDGLPASFRNRSAIDGLPETNTPPPLCAE